MTIKEGKIGCSYLVQNMQLEHQTSYRLQALGLTEGTKLTILNNKRRGAVIFRVRGTRLAVGREIAKAIEIQEA